MTAVSTHPDTLICGYYSHTDTVDWSGIDTPKLLQQKILLQSEAMEKVEPGCGSGFSGIQAESTAITWD